MGLRSVMRRASARGGGARRFAIDRAFVRRAARLLGLLVADWAGGAMLAGVLLVGVLDQVITYYVGIVPSEFYIVLGGRDQVQFRWLALKAVIIIIAKAMALASISYLCSVLYLSWRRTLVSKLHSLYFRRLAFYKLNVLTDHIDNPDQRMTQDSEKATRLLATVILVPGILAPFIIIYYTYKTYESTGYLGPLTIYLYFVAGTIVNKVLLSPVVNLVVRQERAEGDFRFKHVSIRTNSESVAFLAAGRAENVLADQSLHGLLGVQRRLVNWQLPLNFSTRLFDYFGGILSYLIIAVPIFILHSYDHITDAKYLSSIISQTSFFYMYLINSFSTVIDLSQHVGEFAGVTHRVMELYEELVKENSDALRDLDSTSRPPSEATSADEKHPPGKGRIVSTDDCLIDMGENELAPDFVDQFQCADQSAFDNRAANVVGPPEPFGPRTDHSHSYQSYATNYGSVFEPAATGAVLDAVGPVAFTLDRCTYVPPTSASFGVNRPAGTSEAAPHATGPLVADLSMQIVKGRHVLITGDSGAGKTSILRILAGLWPCAAGKLQAHWRRTRRSLVAFVPQRAYLPVGGTLRSQIAFPHKADGTEKEAEQIEQILHKLKLEHLIVRANGLDTPVEFDWCESVTPGELQRVSIARLLYGRPLLACLDECTSALGFDVERLVYQLMHAAGITCVSVGHRASLRMHHQVELHLEGGGHWTISEIGNEPQRSPAADAPDADLQSGVVGR